MLHTKQKQLQREHQQFNLYQQMQKLPLGRSASVTRPQIPSLLSLPNRPPRLPDPHLHLGPRITQRPSVGHPPPGHNIIRPNSSRSPSLLGPSPIMPPTMVMHQMGGMQAGRGKRPPPFLPAGARQSLLGPAPVGAPFRNSHVGFVPGRPPQMHGHYKNKEGSLHASQRQRENGYIVAGKSNGQMNKKKSDVKATEKELQVSAESQVSCSEQTRPSAKKQKTEGADELVEESESGDTEQKSNAELPVVTDEGEKLAGEDPSTEATEDLEQSRTAEVQGVGTSLKVTIQRSSESRAFSTGLEEAAASASVGTDKETSKTADKFSCYICNVSSPDQQDFQTHMISLDHQQKLMEIQHMSSACLATLLPHMQFSLKGTPSQKGRGLQRWCAFCQCHFTGDLIEHRRTKKHKMAKVSSRPFCTVCERHFRTPRKFVEHMKSPEHKQRVEELRAEGDSEVMEELITVDAIGCFEGEDDYEEEGNEDEEEDAASEEQVIPETNDKEYDPDTQYGTSFVVPVAGFLCKLCHKFYHFESSARETHCKSLMHYQNLQKYNAMVDLAEEDEESLSTTLDAQKPDNSNDCAAEMQDTCKQEEQKEETTKCQPVPSTTCEEEELSPTSHTDLIPKPLTESPIIPNPSVDVKAACDGDATTPNKRPRRGSQKI